MVLERPVGAEERVVDAALRCLARWGMAKTTLDDVAREAGIRRATLYRAVPRRARGAHAGGRGRRDGPVPPPARRPRRRRVDSVEDADRRRGRRGGDDARHPRGVPVPAGPRARGDRSPPGLRPDGRRPAPGFGARRSLLDPWLPDGETAARVAEWLARIVLSYVCTVPVPAAGDICDEAWVRHLVRVYVVPGLSTTDHQPRETNHG